MREDCYKAFQRQEGKKILIYKRIKRDEKEMAGASHPRLFSQ